MGALKRWMGWLVLLLILVFGILFAIQNATRVPLDLLVIRLPELWLSLWIVLAFALGGGVGLALSSATIIRLRAQVSRLQRRLDKTTRTLHKQSVSESQMPAPAGGNGGAPKVK